MTLHTLQNEYWQAGILPQTGASIAFGRVRKDGQWIDVLRSTAESDYGNSSNCSSFIMLPWCNRIKNGLLRFDGQEYQLRTTKDDGTARHGDVRGRSWRVDEADAAHIRMSIRSDDYPDMNWPFKFSATAVYELDEADFIWTLTLKNEDTRPMPAGFGHHPYFVKPAGIYAPELHIPCDQQFELINFLAVAAPVPVKPELDFRFLRSIDGMVLNDLLTNRIKPEYAPFILYPNYPSLRLQIDMRSDPVFEHFLIFTPENKPFFALEPMSNASDGFNLYANGIPGSGVFVLQPAEEKTGIITLEIHHDD